MQNREAVTISSARESDLVDKLFEAIPSPIFFKDAHGRYRGGNTAWSRTILGLPLDAIIGRTVFELPIQIPEDLAKKYHEADQALMREKRDQTYEAEVLCADGERREYRFHKAVVTTEDGRTAGIVGVMTDVTEKNRTHRLLAQQTEQYEKLLSDASVGIYVTDLDGWFVHGNASFVRILGFDSLEEMTKVNASACYIDADDRVRLVETLKAEGSVNRVLGLRRTNGDLFDAMVFARLRGSRIEGFVSEIHRDRDLLLIVICAWCGRMREDEDEPGTWAGAADFLQKNKARLKDTELDFEFTHGICYDCAQSLRQK